MKKKSIIIKEFHHKELVKISKTFGTQYGDLVESMISYFKKTGINPIETINENPATMVKALDKRIISFLKVQERDILKPLRNDVFGYSSLQKKQYEDLHNKVAKLSTWVNDAVVKINDFDQKRTKKIVDELNIIESKFKKQQEAIIILAQLMDTKNKAGVTGKIKSIFD
ncbi:BfmA/BtgA family mobilization protein [Olleya namhaensis]|uniref:BfmA/BtgA family mobilization protein n=1 Tax=Olleya namhaensis TaxID=1144750 RepID=UPI00232E3875|nr:BfmA/BtgA family mobilization protein [Olleya namhaensis]